MRVWELAGSSVTEIKRPRIRTMTPVNVKNFFNHLPLSTAETKPMERSPGTVPRAKSIIASAPVTKLPVLTAYACMASVNPHGKKNVAAQVPRIDVFDVHSPSTFLPRNFGNFGEKLPSRGERLVRFSPRSSITTPTSAVVTPKKRLEKWMIDPKSQRIPPRSPNPRIRPRWK